MQYKYEASAYQSVRSRLCYLLQIFIFTKTNVPEVRRWKEEALLSSDTEIALNYHIYSNVK